MGNSCVEESQNKLEMITSYSEGLEKNLVVYIVLISYTKTMYPNNSMQRRASITLNLDRK